MTFTACRSRIDLAALHSAYLAEGFIAVDSPQYCNPETHTCYQKYSGMDIFVYNVPNMPVDDSDLWDQLEALHEEAADAVRFLWEASGNAHFELGSLVLAPEAMDCD